MPESRKTKPAGRARIDGVWGPAAAQSSVSAPSATPAQSTGPSAISNTASSFDNKSILRSTTAPPSALGSSSAAAAGEPDVKRRLAIDELLFPVDDRPVSLLLDGIDMLMPPALGLVSNSSAASPAAAMSVPPPARGRHGQRSSLASTFSSLADCQTAYAEVISSEGAVITSQMDSSSTMAAFDSAADKSSAMKMLRVKQTDLSAAFSNASSIPFATASGRAAAIDGALKPAPKLQAARRAALPFGSPDSSQPGSSGATVNKAQPASSLALAAPSASPSAASAAVVTSDSTIGKRTAAAASVSSPTVQGSSGNGTIVSGGGGGTLKAAAKPGAARVSVASAFARPLNSGHAAGTSGGIRPLMSALPNNEAAASDADGDSEASTPQGHRVTTGRENADPSYTPSTSSAGAANQSPSRAAASSTAAAISSVVPASSSSNPGLVNRRLGVIIGSAIAQGQRKTQEDALFASASAGGDESLVLGAVFDGHGGESLSRWVSGRIEAAIVEAIKAHRELNAYAHEGSREAAADEHIVVVSTGESGSGVAQLVSGDDDRPAESGTDASASAVAANQPSSSSSSSYSSSANRLCTHYAPSDPDFRRLLTLVLTALDEEALSLAEAGSLPKDAGTCAAVALLYGDALIVANVGDCEAWLCRGGRPYELTCPHKAERDTEVCRVTHTGGQLSAWGGGGVRVAGALRVSRSIGMHMLKRPLYTGLISDPFARVARLRPQQTVTRPASLAAASGIRTDSSSRSNVSGTGTSTVTSSVLSGCTADGASTAAVDSTPILREISTASSCSASAVVDKSPVQLKMAASAPLPTIASASSSPTAAASSSANNALAAPSSASLHQQPSHPLDEFVLLASDGLLDVFPSRQDLMNKVKRALRATGSADGAAAAVVREAVRDRRAPDNVSLVLILLNQCGVDTASAGAGGGCVGYARRAAARKLTARPRPEVPTLPPDALAAHLALATANVAAANAAEGEQFQEREANSRAEKASGSPTAAAPASAPASAAAAPASSSPSAGSAASGLTSALRTFSLTGRMSNSRPGTPSAASASATSAAAGTAPSTADGGGSGSSAFRWPASLTLPRPPSVPTSVAAAAVSSAPSSALNASSSGIRSRPSRANTPSSPLSKPAAAVGSGSGDAHIYEQKSRLETEDDPGSSPLLLQSESDGSSSSIINRPQRSSSNSSLSRLAAALGSVAVSSAVSGKGSTSRKN